MMDMPRRSVGFIGLGKMGGHMARRIVDAGHLLTVFDPAAEALEPLVAAGAVASASVREVADRAEIVFASLPMPGIVRAAAMGPGGLCEGSAIKVFVDT